MPRLWPRVSRMSQCSFCFSLTFFAGAIACLPVAAKELPLWEAGIGAAGLSMPDYRGATERSAYLWPLPYLVYRGEKLNIDRDGIHGNLFRSDRIKLEISLNVGPPAESGAGVRNGMPDLDPTVEAGPALKILLATNAARDRTWSVGLPLRAVIATDFSHVDRIGWVFSPYIQYEAVNVGPGGGWTANASAGPLYASEKYHDYYYEVAPSFATANRPAFDARGGYSGSRVTLAMSKRFARFWVGAFARYDALAGAAFEDSPLVGRDNAFMIGAGAAWIFARSSQTVQRGDDPLHSE